MRVRKPIVIVVFLLAGATGGFLFLLIHPALSPQQAPRDLALGFVGFTNRPGQGRSAIIAITNMSQRPIHFYVAFPQLQSGGRLAPAKPAKL